MTKISIVVAKSLNDVIGVNNQLPWHLPADLKYFKQLTTGQTIIMGRKTFESIGRALPNRRNIVITRDKKFQKEGIEIVHSIQSAIDLCSHESEIFIIGGDNIYKQTLHLTDRLYITKVDVTIENGNAFFPKIDENIWELTHTDSHNKDEKNEFDYQFLIFERKTNI